MVGGDWEGDGGKSCKKRDPPPPKAKPPPPKPQPPKLVARKSPKSILSWMTHHMEPPPPPKRNPPPQGFPTSKATPPPKTNPPQKGGRIGTDHPIVSTNVHGPYSPGVDMGTVRVVHRRRTGVVSVEYPRNATPYEVARHLLFPSPEASHEHLELMGKIGTQPA